MGPVGETKKTCLPALLQKLVTLGYLLPPSVVGALLLVLWNP
jgi:ABC-type molybdate transport system permease subunit